MRNPRVHAVVVALGHHADCRAARRVRDGVAAMAAAGAERVGGLAGLEHEALVRNVADRVRVVEAEHGLREDVDDCARGSCVRFERSG